MFPTGICFHDNSDLKEQSQLKIEWYINPHGYSFLQIVLEMRRVTCDDANVCLDASETEL